LRPTSQAQTKAHQQSSPQHKQQQQHVSALLSQSHPKPPPSVQLFHSRPFAPPSPSRSLGNFYVSESGFGGSSDEEDYATASELVHTSKVANSAPLPSSLLPSSSSLAAATATSSRAASLSLKAPSFGSPKVAGASLRSVSDSSDRSGSSSNQLRGLMSELLSSLRKLSVCTMLWLPPDVDIAFTYTSNRML
jgi:hypothetical protein